jgi:broad specificity phosphatase PhoE
MAAVYLVRHGEADYTHIRDRNWPGATADLAPLSEQGYQEALRLADELSALRATVLVSAPMTRALQTAGIVAARLRLPVQVHFDLHEWLPDDSFGWRSYPEVLAAVADFDSCGWEWPPGERRPWEPLSHVRARATAALRAVTAGLGAEDVLIAVCHGMLIWSLTGERSLDTGQWRQIDFG